MSVQEEWTGRMQQVSGRAAATLHPLAAVALHPLDIPRGVLSCRPERQSANPTLV
jgi:hypothetical protein